MNIDRVKLISEMARQRISVKDLAEKSSVSRVTITAIRGGKRCSKVVAAAIAKALDVPLEKLLED